MGKPYSEDLRVRVVRAGQRGGTIPEIAEQFGVALEMLAVWGCCTGATLLAHGFNVDMLAGLVRDGLANAHREPVKADGRIIKVARVRITNAGRMALEG